MDEKASMRELYKELDSQANPDLYDVDAKAAQMFVNAREESEKLAQRTRQDAQDAAAKAAADNDEFQKDSLAKTKLAAMQEQAKAEEDARNAAIAEEEAAEISMMAMRETGLAMGDLLRAKLG